MKLAGFPWALPVLGGGRSRARVLCYRGERRKVERTAQRLFGRGLSPREYAGLAGAPDDALVEVGTLGAGLYLEMGPFKGYLYHAVELVRRARDGPVLVIDAVRVHRAVCGRGLGLGIFARQLVAATALGIARIETSAGRSVRENGYYTWPRFGFDGPLPAEIRRRLPVGLEHARSVLDLVEFPAGRQWWKEHGTGIDLTFDLAIRSRSRDLFGEYVRHRLGHVPGPAWTSCPGFSPQ
jgi:hypothetical protein